MKQIKLDDLVHKKVLTLKEAQVWYNMGYRAIISQINSCGMPFTLVGCRKYFHKDRVDEWFSKNA